MKVTDETRRDAKEKVNAAENRIRVLGVILGSSVPLGASQVADRLGWGVTSVRESLTELTNAGQIEAVGKHLLPSGRKEATFFPVRKTGNAWDSHGQGILGGLYL